MGEAGSGEGRVWTQINMKSRSLVHYSMVLSQLFKFKAQRTGKHVTESRVERLWC